MMKVKDIIKALAYLNPEMDLEVMGPDGQDHDKLPCFGQINLQDMPPGNCDTWMEAPYNLRSFAAERGPGCTRP